MKPMLATAVALEQVQYPVLVSAKLDGIRCLGTSDGPRTRTLKPIPNTYVRNMLSDKLFTGFDGELIVGSPSSPDVFSKTTSGVMSVEGRPDFTWVVFDLWNVPDLEYQDRLEALKVVEGMSPWGNTRVLSQEWALDEYGLLKLEALYLSLGYEGVILRDPTSPYKYGRSTVREGYLLKRKPLADAEGVIIAYRYLERNGNPIVRDAVGNAKRSDQQANQVPDYEQVGVVTVEVQNGPFAGTVVSIGTGFTETDRRMMAVDTDLIGKTVTFTYQASGSKDAPRFPSFKGFRKD